MADLWKANWNPELFPYFSRKSQQTARAFFLKYFLLIFSFWDSGGSGTFRLGASGGHGFGLEGIQSEQLQVSYYEL